MAAIFTDDLLNRFRISFIFVGHGFLVQNTKDLYKTTLITLVKHTQHLFQEIQLEHLKDTVLGKGVSVGTHRLLTGSK